MNVIYLQVKGIHQTYVCMCVFQCFTDVSFESCDPIEVIHFYLEEEHKRR